MISKLPIYTIDSSPLDSPSSGNSPVKFYLYKGFPLKRKPTTIPENWISIKG